MIYKMFFGNNFYRLFFIIFSLFFTSSSFAAVLRWSPVGSTEECIIEGYKVNYGTTSGQYNQVIDVGNVTYCDLDTLQLVSGRTYYFAINAYSTALHAGPLSYPLSYTPYISSPSIIKYPAIDYSNKSIDVSFNKNNMQGADIKINYKFLPEIFFSDAHIIDEIDNTYRLFMEAVPGQKIITMTITDVTDSENNALIFNTIVLNDNDNDSMADDWESYYGITAPYLNADSDGLSNVAEFIRGSSPVNYDEFDNCPQIYNPDQSDWDLNGIGDACDINPPGDFNKDFDVDGSDAATAAQNINYGFSTDLIKIIASQFGIYSENIFNINPDFNKDGDVDGSDAATAVQMINGGVSTDLIKILASEFGKS